MKPPSLTGSGHLPDSGRHLAPMQSGHRLQWKIGHQELSNTEGEVLTRCCVLEARALLESQSSGDTVGRVQPVASTQPNSCRKQL